MRFEKKILLVPALLLPFGCNGLNPARSNGAAPGTKGPAITREKAERISTAYRAGLAAFRKADTPAVLKAFQEAYALNPGDDMAAYYMAAAYGRAGDVLRSVEWLGKLEKAGSAFAPQSQSFGSIERFGEFREAARKLAEKRPKIHRSEAAFVVPEKDLIPEGIAYDPAEKAFYLSSLHKRKIVKVLPGAPGAPAKVEDFVSAGQDGLFAVLGLKVDAKRRHLWAASAAEFEMKGYTEKDAGRSAVFQYDLPSRKLVRKLTAPGTGAHVFNDLAVSEAGDVYVTDTEGGAVWRIPAGKGEMEPLVAAGTLDAPNGLALSEDGRRLYVADIAQGIVAVDPATGTVTRMTQPVGLWPAAIDGLALHGGSLVGIVNVVGGGRIVRFALNAKGDGFTRSEVLDCGHPAWNLPTTGVVVDGALYYVANSQFQSFVKPGETLPLEELQEVLILRLPL